MLVNGTDRSDPQGTTMNWLRSLKRHYWKQRFFLEGFRRHLLLGLLVCTMVAFMVGLMAEIFVNPGAPFKAVQVDTAVLNGEAVFADVDFDGWLDRLRESRTKFEQASFSLETRHSGSPNPTQQFYFSGSDILPYPYATKLDSNRVILAALTDAKDSLDVRLNLRTFYRDGHTVDWSGPLAGPDWPVFDKLHRPMIAGAVTMMRGGIPCVYLKIDSHFNGWRGGIVLDPDFPEKRIEYPSGLTPSLNQNNWLRGPEGRILWAMGSSAPHNGNTLGGIADDRARLFLFDPDSGFIFLRDFGPDCSSLFIQPLQDRRHALLTTKHGMLLEDSLGANAAIWDSWTNEFEATWWIEDLIQNTLVDSAGVYLAFNQGIVSYLDGTSWTLREVGRIQLENGDRLLPRDGFWIRFNEANYMSVHDKRGRMLARIPLKDQFEFPTIERAVNGLAEARLHVALPSMILSFRFDSVPWPNRVLENPATPVTGLLAFLVLLASLSRRISLQERILRSIVDSGSEAVGIFDPNGRLLFANECFLRDTDSGTIGEVLKLCTESDEPVLQKVRNRWIRWTIRGLSIQGRHFGRALLGVDESASITQQELTHLVALSRSLGHNMRQPLTAIQRAEGNVLALLEQSDPLVAAEARDSLESIRLSVLNLDQRITNFIALVRVDAKWQWIDPATLVDSVLADLHLENMSGIELLKEQPSAVPAVCGSLASLRAMLDVVVANALEAMIRKGKLSVNLCSANEFLEIRVSDTGPGIAPEMLADIWTPGRTTKSTGLGYGLYFARGIARIHGGEIQVEHSSPAGTVMLVRLPLEPPASMKAGIERRPN
ncbi:MAG: HAMP domain-containing histidine kinase [Candidatus Cloacimonetes bacterium]|nr:HAMP domain-containing histidine kinase [Candidatus Cloacimonadota bacterium]